MRTVTIKMSEELLIQLDLFCKKVSKNRSEVIREAIIEYLHRHQGKPITINTTEEYIKIVKW